MIQMVDPNLILEFEPKGFVTNEGFVGFVPDEVFRFKGILFETEQEYMDWIREVKEDVSSFEEEVKKSQEKDDIFKRMLDQWDDWGT